MTAGSLHMPQEEGTSSSHEPMFTQTVSCLEETECRVVLSLAHVSTRVYRILESYQQSPRGCILLQIYSLILHQDVLSRKKLSAVFTTVYHLVKRYQQSPPGCTISYTAISSLQQGVSS
jgi:hypothetical protein